MTNPTKLEARRGHLGRRVSYDREAAPAEAMRQRIDGDVDYMLSEILHRERAGCEVREAMNCFIARIVRREAGVVLAEIQAEAAAAEAKREKRRRAAEQKAAA